MKKCFIVLLILVNAFEINAQTSSSVILEENLSTHVSFLSDDLLEGRATGSQGEKIAQSYIADYFVQYGISPYGSNGFLQEFDFTLGKKLIGENFLSVNNTSLRIKDDYFPMSYSGNGNIDSKIVNVGFGIDAGDLYNDFADKTKLEGKVFLINLSSPDGIHPHSKYKDYTDYITRVKTAQKYGASAIILYNEDKHLDDPVYNIKRNTQAENIPIIYLHRTFIKDIKNNTPIKLSVQMQKDERKGENVVGFIDNGANKTVVIGAHYDHLGWGKDGGSLHHGLPQIHNGADDNASGVSLLLELAHFLKKLPNQKNNYLFICFSAEELGLIGSKSYLINPTIDLSTINYMINLDMVGRLDPDTRELAVGGIGTSPLFKTYTKSITDGLLDIKTSESGMGPSDHASFYMKDIPVLFLFTGTHRDYHKPSDDAWKINYKGMSLIFEYTIALISKLDAHEKLEFVKTKEKNTGSTKRRFSVTLGVIPDYMFDGVGMRIDAVNEGRPAYNGGIIDGDIVTKMGDIEIKDMMSYMTALGKFKKGDKTAVEVVRNNEVKRFNITF